MSRVRVGISGWRYPPWRGEFYPKGLVQRKELAYASRAVPTIEINGSFYSLQRPESYANWFDGTPDDFIFSVKAPKLITHQKRLRNIEAPVANFFASGVLRLRHKLGPVLWQLPPSMKFDPAVIETFLAQLPHDTEHALALAEQHDDAVKGHTWLEIDAKRPLRHAMEVRHESFIDEAFVRLLRQYHVAFVVAGTAGRWPEKDDVTADFVYVRLHGALELYRSGYSDAEIDHWAAKLQNWQHGRQPVHARLISEAAPAQRASRDVFCYFDNTDKLKAPLNAARTLKKIGWVPSELDLFS
jgi:uncharacterized protein YecE (DUF72 family)